VVLFLFSLPLALGGCACVVAFQYPITCTKVMDAPRCFEKYSGDFSFNSCEPMGKASLCCHSKPNPGLKDPCEIEIDLEVTLDGTAAASKKYQEALALYGCPSTSAKDGGTP
jgi:hypothetical protein